MKKVLLPNQIFRELVRELNGEYGLWLLGTLSVFAWYSISSLFNGENQGFQNPIFLIREKQK